MSSWLHSVFPLQVTGSVGLPVGSNRLMVFPRSAGRVAFLVRRIFVQRGAARRGGGTSFSPSLGGLIAARDASVRKRSITICCGRTVNLDLKALANGIPLKGDSAKSATAPADGVIVTRHPP